MNINIYINSKGYTPSDALQDLRRDFGLGDLPATQDVFVYPERDRQIAEKWDAKVAGASPDTVHILTRSQAVVDGAMNVARQEGNSLTFHVRRGGNVTVTEFNPALWLAYDLGKLLK